VPHDAEANVLARKLSNRRYYEKNAERIKQKNLEWKRANRKKVTEYDRARQLKTEVRIDYRVVYERDQGLCQICLEPIPFDDMTLDHIIPLSRGGEHTYENVQTAHLSCNCRKGVSCP
jgi:5-methylcytosine-specific restriction endonuclease McrA